MYLNKKILYSLELRRNGRCVVLNKLIVQGVFMVSSLLFRLDNASLHQNLYMMADGRLRQIDYILNFRALTTATLLGDMMQYFKPVRISKCL